MKLTPNFSLEEFTNKEGLYVPADLDEKDALTRITRLAQALQEIRDALAGPRITVTSGFRTPEDQARINPDAPDSLHLHALAADFVVEGFNPREVYLLLARTWPGGLGAYERHNHIDLRHLIFRPRARWIV